MFKERFPHLFSSLKQTLCSAFEIETAKNGSPTAKENGLLLHSKYNPEKEAESLASSFDANSKETAVFLGFGLGYGPIALAKKHPEALLILFESDVSRFFSALNAIDWSDFFKHKKIILALGIPLNEATSILKNCSSEKTQVFRSTSQSLHDEKYFDSIENLIKQLKEKDEINTNTLEKFANLWLSNSCRNLSYIETLDGVNKFKDTAKNLPFVILAAGPSLKKILPLLGEIKKKAITVCVDTALHACLREGMEPDFVILSDPQYYCSLHLEFLESPSSVLITEIAAYPSVFRFKCKEKVLFSSMFPIGQFFESRLGQKGSLKAGGSVTTTAYDFACLCGTREIFIAGMDLGFPKKETHIKGSQFEEKAHSSSTRTRNTETDNIKSLFSARPFNAKDYNGNSILTDKRMSLFSWWFETQCEKEKESGRKTFSLTPESLEVKGIEKSSIEDFLLKPEILEQKKEFFASAEENCKNIFPQKNISFTQVKTQFAESLETLCDLAKEGLSLCKKGLQDISCRPEIYKKMDKLDKKITSSSGKDAASLVFPTKRQLDRLASQIPQKTERDKAVYSIKYSQLIYTELLKSAESYKKFF